MPTQLQKTRGRMQATYPEALRATMQHRFQIDVETFFDTNIAQLVSKRTDGQEFTAEMHTYIEAYATGYGHAVAQVKGIAK